MPKYSKDHNRKENKATNTPRILLAEDDREMRVMLAQALRGVGYKVIECPDGWNLLHHLGTLFLPEDRKRTGLIISDIKMPGISGIEILAALHAFKPLPPMIFITAFGDEETHDMAEELGVIAMFDKPFEIDLLLEEVQKIFPVFHHYPPSHQKMRSKGALNWAILISIVATVISIRILSQSGKISVWLLLLPLPVGIIAFVLTYVFIKRIESLTIPDTSDNITREGDKQ